MSNHALILLELEMQLLSGKIVKISEFNEEIQKKYKTKIDRKTFCNYIKALKHFYKQINYYNNVHGWIME